MDIYVIILFITSIFLFVLSALIKQGNTRLIHDYHQTRVREDQRMNYAKDFSKGVLGIGVSLFASAALYLLNESHFMIEFSVGVMVIGMIISTILLIRVQKKYNGGIF